MKNVSDAFILQQDGVGKYRIIRQGERDGPNGGLESGDSFLFNGGHKMDTDLGQTVICG